MLTLTVRWLWEPIQWLSWWRRSSRSRSNRSSRNSRKYRNSKRCRNCESWRNWELIGAVGLLGIVRAEGTLKFVLLWLRRKAWYGCAIWTKNADSLLTFFVRKVRAMISDADWLWPQLGMRMGGRSLLRTWFMGDIICGKNSFFVRQLFRFSH